MYTTQVEIVSLDDTVNKEHPYRAFKGKVNFDDLAKAVTFEEHYTGVEGFGKSRLLLCLVRFSGSKSAIPNSTRLRLA